MRPIRNDEPLRVVDGFSETFARAQQGDRQAQGALLEEHLDGLRAFVRLKSGRLLRDRISASDLVQSACRDALQGLERVECADEAAFRAWLYRVALHKVLAQVDRVTAQRRDARREVAFDALPDPEGLLQCYGVVCSPSRDAIAQEEVARIEAAFDQLSEEQREVLLMARLEGRPHRDIATELGKSEAAVRQLLSRARARLGLILDEMDRDD